MSHKERLFTSEFLALNAIIFLTYCNMALFFEFHKYLQTLPIPGEWSGLLIGIFSLAVLVLRPIISPFIQPGNALPWLVVSTVGVILALLSYNLAHDVVSMVLVRLPMESLT